MSPGVLAWGGWGQLGQLEALGCSPFPAPLSARLFEGAVWQSPSFGGIMPNATENQILILVPLLQGGGGAFGDGVPKIRSLHPLRAPPSWGCHHGGCGGSALRIGGRVLPRGCSVTLLCPCGCSSVPKGLGQDQEKEMGLAVGPGTASSPSPSCSSPWLLSELFPAFLECFVTGLCTAMGDAPGNASSALGSTLLLPAPSPACPGPTQPSSRDSLGHVGTLQASVTSLGCCPVSKSTGAAFTPLQAGITCGSQQSKHVQGTGTLLGLLSPCQLRVTALATPGQGDERQMFSLM